MKAGARPGRAGGTEMEPQGAADLCRRIAENAAAQAAEEMRGSGPAAAQAAQLRQPSGVRV